MRSRVTDATGRSPICEPNLHGLSARLPFLRLGNRRRGAAPQRLSVGLPVIRDEAGRVTADHRGGRAVSVMRGVLQAE